MSGHGVDTVENAELDRLSVRAATAVAQRD